MKIKNSPEKIYLVVGESCDEKDTNNFKDLHGVSWCDERIYDGDIEYIRADLVVEKTMKENKKK
jgi:hypothetical protein